MTVKGKAEIMSTSDAVFDL